MLVVSDTSPIRALSVIGQVGLIRDIYGGAILPPDVVSELSVQVPNVPRFVIDDYPFLHVKMPGNTQRVAELQSSLGPGEAQAIALALELQAQAILIDEQQGRRVAERLGLKPVGLLAVLSNAKSRGCIAAIAPLVDTLKSRISFRVHPDILSRVLRDCGEM